MAVLSAGVSVRLHRWRRITQLLALFFIFAIPFININGYRFIEGTFYSMHIVVVDFADPALVLQNILLTGSLTFSFFIAGFFSLLTAVLLGKVFCSWICPYNLIAEWALFLRKKIPGLADKVQNKNPQAIWHWPVPALIFLITAICAIPWITLISFPGMISGQAADWIMWGTAGVELSAIVVILLAESLSNNRFWCKHVCPSGALLGAVYSRYMAQVQHDPGVCANRCPRNDNGMTLCGGVCPLQLDPRQKGLYPYCNNCGDCVSACQEKGRGALSFGFNKKPTTN